MKTFDIFSGEDFDKKRLEEAVRIVEEHGYRVVCSKEEARDLAIEVGYKVLTPVFVDEKIVTLKDLRKLFYSRLYEKFKIDENYMFGNYQIDLKYLRLLVEEREAEGLNRFNAIQEAAAIINIIFDNLDEFNFDRVPDIRILGQKKMAWVTDKALRLMNERIEKNKMLESKNIAEDIEVQIEKEMNGSKNNLQKILDNLER